MEPVDDRTFSALDDEALLTALDEERRKFTRANNERMMLMVDELIRRGVYPAQSRFYTPYKMMEGWGAHWHTWQEPLGCPHCQTDLRDHENGPPFKREVAVMSPSRDRSTSRLCPDCKQAI